MAWKNAVKLAVIVLVVGGAGAVLSGCIVNPGSNFVSYDYKVELDSIPRQLLNAGGSTHTVYFYATNK